MLVSNNWIFSYTEELNKILSDNSIRYPAKINYILQKNYRVLISLYQEINEARVAVFEQYCTSKEENGTYHFEDNDKLASANRELMDLMSVEQEVKIMKFNIDALGDIALTSEQMATLMVMIKDEEEGGE